LFGWNKYVRQAGGFIPGGRWKKAGKKTAPLREERHRFYLFWARERAMDNWSGQEVALAPH